MLHSFYIKRKFAALLQNGYTFTSEYQRGVYQTILFCGQTYSVNISLDYRCEFINLKIKKGTKVVLETCGRRVVINDFECSNLEFSSSLKGIYAMPRKSISLSHRQTQLLIDLYANYASSVLGL